MAAWRGEKTQRGNVGVMQEYLGLSGESQGPYDMLLCLFKPGPKEPQEREERAFLQKPE